MLERHYIGATGELLDGYREVTVVLQGCYRGVSRVLQGGYRGVTGCYGGVAGRYRVVKGCYNCFTGVLQGNLTHAIVLAICVYFLYISILLFSIAYFCIFLLTIEYLSSEAGQTLVWRHIFSVHVRVE